MPWTVVIPHAEKSARATRFPASRSSGPVHQVLVVAPPTHPLPRLGFLCGLADRFDDVARSRCHGRPAVRLHGQADIYPGMPVGLDEPRHEVTPTRIHDGCTLRGAGARDGRIADLDREQLGQDGAHGGVRDGGEAESQDHGHGDQGGVPGIHERENGESHERGDRVADCLHDGRGGLVRDFARDEHHHDHEGQDGAGGRTQLHHRAGETALVLRGVLHGQQGGAVPFAADRHALQEPQDGQRGVLAAEEQGREDDGRGGAEQEEVVPLEGRAHVGADQRFAGLAGVVFSGRGMFRGAFGRAGHDNLWIGEVVPLPRDPLIRAPGTVAAIIYVARVLHRSFPAGSRLEGVRPKFAAARRLSRPVASGRMNA